MPIHVLWLSALVAALGLTQAVQAQITVRTVQGEAIAGIPIAITEKGVSVEREMQRVELVAKELVQVVSNEDAVPAKFKVQVGLDDGTRISALRYTTSGTKATLELPDSSKLEVPLRNINWVRLSDFDSTLAEQWQEILSEPSTSDRLIVRRAGDAGKLALDVMEGVVGTAGEVAIDFDLSGDALKVKREKIAGLTYFHKAGAKQAAAKCEVVDIDGSTWAAASLVFQDGKLKVATPSAVSVSLTLDRVRSIDYASSNQRYLSDLPHDAVTRSSWFEIVATKSDVIGKGFTPQFDRTPSGTIQVGGEMITKGVWMPAVSTMVVDVPAGFTKLTARLGVDDHVGATDGVKLTVEADGKVLFDKLVTRTPKTEPMVVELGSARRIRIRTDFGGKSRLGDQIVLCEAKFVR